MMKVNEIKGTNVFVYKSVENNGFKFLNMFVSKGLFFVVYENGKCVVESLGMGKPVCIDGLDVSLVNS